MNPLMLVRGQNDCSQLLLERLYLRFYCAMLSLVLKKQFDRTNLLFCIRLNSLTLRHLFTVHQFVGQLLYYVLVCIYFFVLCTNIDSNKCNGTNLMITESNIFLLTLFPEIEFIGTIQIGLAVSLIVIVQKITVSQCRASSTRLIICPVAFTLYCTGLLCYLLYQLSVQV